MFIYSYLKFSYVQENESRAMFLLILFLLIKKKKQSFLYSSSIVMNEFSRWMEGFFL